MVVGQLLSILDGTDRRRRDKHTVPFWDETPAAYNWVTVGWKDPAPKERTGLQGHGPSPRPIRQDRNPLGLRERAVGTGGRIDAHPIAGGIVLLVVQARAAAMPIAAAGTSGVC